MVYSNFFSAENRACALHIGTPKTAHRNSRRMNLLLQHTRFFSNPIMLWMWMQMSCVVQNKFLVKISLKSRNGRF